MSGLLLGWLLWEAGQRAAVLVGPAWWARRQRAAQLAHPPVQRIIPQHGA